jgi:hypothetical protein
MGNSNQKTYIQKKIIDPNLYQKKPNEHKFIYILRVQTKCLIRILSSSPVSQLLFN